MFGSSTASGLCQEMLRSFVRFWKNRSVEINGRSHVASSSLVEINLSLSSTWVSETDEKLNG